MRSQQDLFAMRKHDAADSRAEEDVIRGSAKRKGKKKQSYTKQ